MLLNLRAQNCLNIDYVVLILGLLTHNEDYARLRELKQNFANNWHFQEISKR